ncbi:CD248 molecule, endosialin a [Gadus macrocephalus]|uniref:CD248 molecule, endosialin a n=1 Tax=Gadus macrocephalus TaxID=80720 RepID=UPI0028CB9D5B|nr:CD248 molecule, endosialin a [Gadus macrocephalus]
MGSAVLFSATLIFSFLWSPVGGEPGPRGQDLRERDALCNEHGCYVVYFQRKTFREAWRSCKADGGNLATVKRPEEAAAIADLFANADLRDLGAAVNVWVGLQRQPRQCKPSRPLRGFTWTTGDQDTEYTNWRAVESVDPACSGLRCVVMAYDSSLPEQSRNFEWLEETCFVPADAYLCRFTYQGMCPALPSEGGGNTLYATPFNLLTTMLTHLPLGSVATVPCPAGTREDQSVLCMSKEGDGVAAAAAAAGWSRDGPLCAANAPAPVATRWCGRDNGGCEHFCREAGDQHYCQCSEGYQLAADGRLCEVDVCHGAPCESECLPLPDRYRCACPEGFMLAPDEESCLDVDECLQSPCEQLCVNSPGSFGCLCREGYLAGVDGECEDVDECMNDPCEQTCENTPGSHVCHCHMGYSVMPEDPRQCQETDECQIPGICEQMCVNYVGGFMCYCGEGYELGPDHVSCLKTELGDGRPTVTPDFPWYTQQPDSVWNPDLFNWAMRTEWPESLDWLTDPPSVQSSDVIWVTSAPQEGMPLHVTMDPRSPAPEHGLGEVEDAGGFQNVFPWELEPEPTSSAPTHTAPPPTTTPPTHTTAPATSPTPEWYDYEEEEATSSVPTLPASTTVSEGAWNWFRFTPASHDPATTEYGEPSWTAVDYNVSPASDHPEEDEAEGNGESLRVLYSSEEPKSAEGEKDNGGGGGGGGGGRDGFANVQHTTSAPGRGEEAASDSAQIDHSEVVEQGHSTWLLVGLLVPIGIFAVVMVALGVVYCTRCAVRPRGKSTTDCYHWISGAHDKPGAQSSSAAGKSHV